MTTIDGRSKTELQKTKLSLLAMAVSHSLKEAQEEISIGANISVFDKCLGHLKVLSESKHVPDRDIPLVGELITDYQLVLGDMPEKQLKAIGGAMLDYFMLAVGHTVAKFADSIEFEVSDFIEVDGNVEGGIYHLTVVRFVFSDEAWLVAAINADPNVPTDTYVNDVKIEELTNDTFWVAALLKGVVVSMAVERANAEKRRAALADPNVAEKAAKMAEIMNVEVKDCLTMALEFNHIVEADDVGYPVTRGKLVQFVKMDFGCSLEQAYKVVQVWFEGNDENIRG